MKTNTEDLAILISAWAVRGTLIAMALTAGAGTALAQEGAQNQNLTRPISTAELGAISVSDGSFKAGEYNGLQNKGGLGIGNFDLKGGGAYNSDSARRWRVTGVDLGLEGRSVSGEIGVQGKSKFTFGYNELLKNRSDSFQTVFDGGGTTAITLPGAWLLPNIAGSTAANSTANITSARGLAKLIAGRPYININTAAANLGGILSPTATQTALVNAAADTGLGLFRNVDLATKRTNLDLALDYSFNPRWGLNASLRPEHRDGTKPMGVVSRATGGDISATVPDVIDTLTNLVNANIQFKGTKGFGQVGYSGSYFKNNIDSVTFQNWALGPASPITNLVMSSTPNNNFSQLHVTGTYRKSSATSLTTNASYSRNTQNDRFLTDTSTPVVPVSSMNGLVVNTAVNAKFTTRPVKRLQLGAAYRYDDRDNQSAVNIYQFMDVNQPLSANASFPAGPNNPLGAVLATNAGANRSYDRKLNQINGDVDFKIARWQTLKGGYEFQRTNRGCAGSWITCANAETTNENVLRAGWRLSLRDDLVGRVDYGYSTRRAPFYNEDSWLAIVPYANVSPAAATGGATIYSYMHANGFTGWGPAAGFAVTTGNANVFFPANSETHLSAYAWENRISELPGLRRYEVADRNRNKARTELDWQANEQLSLRIGADLDTSDYLNSRYGLTDASNRGVSADGSYALADFTASVFYTYEDLRSGSAGNTFTVNSNGTAVNGVSGLSGNLACNSFTTLQQRNNNAKLDPCLDWTTARRDKVNTAGFGLAKGAGPLDLTSDLTFSRARSDNNVTGGNYVNNPLTGPGAPPTNVAAFYIPATALPTVKTDTVELRLHGRYALTPRMSLLMGYAYQRMKSQDYFYEGLQVGDGTIVNVFPTNEQPFNYGVHSFGLSYIFAF